MFRNKTGLKTASNKIYSNTFRNKPTVSCFQVSHWLACDKTTGNVSDTAKQST